MFKNHIKNGAWHDYVIFSLFAITLLGWLGAYHPILEIIPNIRMQLLGLAGFFALIAAIRSSPDSIVLATLIVAINFYYVSPYIFNNPNPVASGVETFEIMQYNIYYDNNDIKAIADHIIEADSDVVVIHELIAKQWQPLELTLSKEYPYTHAEPFEHFEGQPSGGMAIISKNPLSAIEVADKYSPPDRKLLAATTVVGDQEITIIGLHPHASRFESRKILLREAQIEAVVQLAKNSETATIVATDMNITPLSPVYQNFLEDTGWQDPHKSVGWHPTWPAWRIPVGLPIDHVFVSNELTMHTYETGDGAGSDHKSLVATVSISTD